MEEPRKEGTQGKGGEASGDDGRDGDKRRWEKTEGKEGEAKDATGGRSWDKRREGEDERR